MSFYEFKGKDENLKTIKDIIQAPTRKDAKDLLRNQGLMVISIKRTNKTENSNNEGKRNLLNFEITKKKIKVKELTLYSRQFATLVRAGIRTTKALDILSKTTENIRLKKITIKIKKDVEKGTKLSDALKKHNEVFGDLYCNMIEASEKSGTLDQALEKLAAYLKKESDIRQKIKSAMIYPSIVLVLLIGLIVFALVFIIPNFEVLFSTFTLELPLPTKILLGSSDWFLSNWVKLLIFNIIIITSFLVFRKTKQGRYTIDRLKLTMPIVKNVSLKAAAERFCSNLSTLQANGVPLIASMEVVGRISNNKVIEDAIYEATERLKEGSEISAPFEEKKIFPILVINMIKVGEQTGDLEKVLTDIADFYQEEVELAIDNMISLIEPAFTILTGLILGFVAVSIVMPMYSMLGQM